MISKFNQLDEFSKIWFKEFLKRVIENCEGGYNADISSIDRGGPTIYGIAENTGPAHKALFEWCKLQASLGKGLSDSTVLDRLASFYYDEYVSTHPLLKTAINQRDYPVAWLFFNLNINGFFRKEITNLFEGMHKRTVKEYTDIVSSSTTTIDPAVFQKYVYFRSGVKEQFHLWLICSIFDNFPISIVKNKAYKLYPSLYKGLVSRFYKNITPLIYSIFGAEGYKYIPNFYLNRESFNKIGSYDGK